MAKKHKHHGLTQLTSADLAARVTRALQDGRTQQGLELAKQLHKQEPTSPHLELLRKAYLERGRQLRAQNYLRDANTVLEVALGLEGGSPEWLAEVAGELAAAGNVSKALQVLDRLPEGPVRGRLLARAADEALAHGPSGRDLLPEALRGQFDAVRRAFQLAEAGQDDGTREALQAVGLQSPFLEWKLLVRGLLAYYQQDDPRAVENWQRLDPARLPARLAAPLRYLIDPPYRAAQPPETQALLQKQSDRLQNPGPLGSLRAIQAALADPEQIPHAFRLADGLVPTLKQQAPHLVPRLAACFFWSVVSSGAPEDVPRFQRIFGAPPEDPNLDRLRALLHEHMGEMDRAHRHWQNFEQAVARHPEAWRPGPGVEAKTIADRVRALVWARMGRNAASVPDLDALGIDLPPFLLDLPGKPKPLKPGPEECFRRSAELAPDRLDAYQELFDYYRDHDELEKAAEAGRRLLARFPEHQPTLEALADVQMELQQYREALEGLQHAARLNPLDRRLRGKIGSAHLFLARQLAEDALFDEARTEYEAALAGAESGGQWTVLCKWAAAEFKAGNDARAEELLQQAQAGGATRLAVAFSILIETIRLKLPRTLKKRFDAEFNAALAEPPTAAAAVRVVETAASHQRAGVTYHGQKTHEKKVLTYVEKSRQADYAAEQLELLCLGLTDLKALKQVRSFATLGQERFPGNPLFFYLEAESYIALGPYRCPRWRVIPLLQRAEQLATEMPPDEKQKKLLEVIRQRQHLVSGGATLPLGPFQDVFDRMYEGDFGDEDEFYDDDEFDEDGPFEETAPKPRKKKPKKKR